MGIPHNWVGSKVAYLEGAEIGNWNEPDGPVGWGVICRPQVGLSKILADNRISRKDVPVLINNLLHRDIVGVEGND